MGRLDGIADGSPDGAVGMNDGIDVGWPDGRGLGSPVGSTVALRTDNDIAYVDTIVVFSREA